MAEGAETVEQAIAFARRFVASRYPQAQGALLSGSRARGEARPGSDYDLFLLFRHLPEGAWREKAWFGEGDAALASARQLAAQTLAAGPPPLASRDGANPPVGPDRASRDPGSCQDGPALTSVGAALHPVLADFTLRAAGIWSASVKRMPSALAELDPELGDRFVAAFAALFGAADRDPVLALADSILARHGARPGDTFRIASPPNRRD